VWVDGIHLKVRLEQDNVCMLVMIGVRADATKELLAVSDRFRESSASWADLLRDCKRRGMTAPVKAACTFATEYGAKWPKAVDQGGHETGRHVGQREPPGQVRLLDGVGRMDGLRRAGWAGR
jgi:Transposase, Mutator family